MSDLLYKHFELKDISDKNRTSTGIISSDHVDRDDEVVDQTSLMVHATTWVRRGGPVLLQHDWTAGVAGRALRVWQDTVKDGLRDITRTWAEIKYGEGYKLDTSGGISVDDVWEQVRQRMLSAHSIGFRAKREPFATGSTTMRLIVTDMMECSVVSVPANPEALVAMAKNLKTMAERARAPRDDAAAHLMAQVALADLEIRRAAGWGQ